MARDMLALWGALNPRQRSYLQALYERDQATEAHRRARASEGFYDRIPASEWRWQMYGPVPLRHHRHFTPRYSVLS